MAHPSINGGTTSDISAIRSETFNGRTYTVVPVVAVVEGVLFGANASAPEFAKAEAFGHVTDGWNGRPVVLNHPKDAEGNFVAANDPAVLEQYQMGFMFNTVLDGKKLKAEMWLDELRISELGGEFQSTLERLQSGEYVEVSVGAFIDVSPEQGVWSDGVSNYSYSGVWSAVVPDHLAILGEGIIGACSVAAGCGAPRLNQVNTDAVHKWLAGEKDLPVAGRQIHVFRSTPPMTVVGKKSCCSACDEGKGGCMSTNSGGDATETPSTEPGTETETPPAAPAPNSKENEPAATPPAKGNLEVEEDRTPEEIAQDAAMDQVMSRQLQFCLQHDGKPAALSVNSIPASMTLDDIQKVVRQALRMKNGRRCYIQAITTDVVVYSSYYDYDYYDTIEYYQVAYSVADDGSVTFSGDPTPVNLVTQIVEAKTPTFSANEAAGDSPTNKDGTMADPVTPPAGTEPAAAAPATFSTMEEYIAAAPAGIREPLQHQARVYENARQALITKLVAHESKAFTAEQLAPKSLDELQQLHTLAGFKVEAAPTPDYSGFGGSTGHQPGITVNAAPAAYASRPTSAFAPAGESAAS